MLVCSALAVGCGPKTPDYQAIWTTSSTATPTETPVPLGKYLEEQGVRAEPMAPDSLTDLTVSIPTPAGWSKRDNPTPLPGSTVIGKGKTYPTAMLTVLMLTGKVNAAELADHVLADAELSQNFHKLDTSTDDFHGFPSVMIQGSQDLDGQRVHTWFRMVLATGRATGSLQHYLVQLTIATLADQAAAQALDVEKIIDGFTVTAK